MIPRYFGVSAGGSNKILDMFGVLRNGRKYPAVGNLAFLRTPKGCVQGYFEM